MKFMVQIILHIVLQRDCLKHLEIQRKVPLKVKRKKMKRIDEIQYVLDENPNASLILIADQTGIPKTSI